MLSVKWQGTADSFGWRRGSSRNRGVRLLPESVGVFSSGGAVNGGSAKAVAGDFTEKEAERAGKTVSGNDPDDVYGIKRRLFGGQCHPGLQKRSGADVWKRGNDRPGDRVYGPADGDEPSG